MILKLNVLNNLNIKNRTRNKVVYISSPKLSLPRSLTTFSIAFSSIRKSNKAWWRGLLALRQSVSQSRVHIKKDSLLRKKQTIASYIKILKV